MIKERGAMVKNKSIKDRDSNRKWVHEIGTRIKVINEPPYRKIYIDYILIAEYLIGSKYEEINALVTLTKNQLVSTPDLATAFGLHHKTMYNYISAYDANGLEGLRPAAHYPGKVNNELIGFIQSEQLKNPHMTLTSLNRKLFQKYEVTLSERTIRMLIVSEAIKPPAKEPVAPDDQISFDDLLKEQPSEDIALVTQEASSKGNYTRYAGYLIFSSMINELFSGIFEYIDKKEFFSSKTWEAKKLITSFILYFMIGITNIEQTKTVNRRELGYLLGEEFAPCSKTLKRNMHDLMQLNLPQVVPELLTQEYIAKGYVEVGQLYYDGHFVPYYGKEDIGSGFFTQRRLAVPGHEQFWANDLRGRPVFFMNSYGFSRFPQAILELCEKAMTYMKQSGNTKPLMVAFDRGGYSSSLFYELSRMGVCWVTWKSGKTKDRPEDAFKETFTLETERKQCEYGILYTTHKMTKAKEPFDAAVILNKKTDKQITILYDIPNNAKGIYQPLDAVMFLLKRWKQENFFKYALTEVDINQTHGLETGTEEDAYYIPNPEYTDLLDRKIKLLKAYEKLEYKKEKFEERYFTLKRKPTFEKYLSSKSYQKILSALEQTSNEIDTIDDEWLKIPASIPYTKKDGSQYTYINFSKINLMNSLKAAVYNMRCRAKDISKEYFKDYRELSKFLEVLTQVGGYYEEGEYHDTVYLNSLETPAYQKAAEKLIDRINQSSPKTLGQENKPLVINFKY
jgi:transposase